MVEDKLNEVLNSVHFGEDFKNPTLRLGRADNCGGRILSSQAVEAIQNRSKMRAQNANLLWCLLPIVLCLR